MKDFFNMKLLLQIAFALACFTFSAFVGLQFTKDTNKPELHWFVGLGMGLGFWIGEKVYNQLTEKK